MNWFKRLIKKRKEAKDRKFAKEFNYRNSVQGQDDEVREWKKQAEKRIELFQRSMRSNLK